MKTWRQCVNLEEPQRQLLEQWVRAHSTPQQVAKRCQIILQSAGGKSDQAIAMELDLNRHTCRLWRERFVECGVDCLWDVEAGRGRKVQAGLAQRIVEATLHSKPAGQTHWTTRKLAKEQGVHASTVARIWQEHELKPHRQKTFKLSRDAKFVEKLLDVVGGSISILPNTPSCSVSMKSVRFKPWIALSLACRSRRVAAAPGRTTTSDTEQRPCLLRSTQPAVR